MLGRDSIAVCSLTDKLDLERATPWLVMVPTKVSFRSHVTKSFKELRQIKTKIFPTKSSFRCLKSITKK